MPRSSSSRSFSSRPSTSPSARPQPRLPLPPPVLSAAPAASSPLVVQHQPNGFMSNVKEGFGLGVGVSVARNVVDGLFNRLASPTPHTQSAAPVSQQSAPVVCAGQQREFDMCMKSGHECIREFDELKACLQSNQRG
jgi:hypothetical protein